MKNDFLVAITQLCSERSLPKEVVIQAVEQALHPVELTGIAAAGVDGFKHSTGARERGFLSAVRTAWHVTFL